MVFSVRKEADREDTSVLAILLGEEAAGELTLRRGSGSALPAMRLDFFGERFRLVGENPDASEKAAAGARKRNGYPYRVESSGGAADGEVFRVREKQGLFRTAVYLRMAMNVGEYCAYPIAAGNGELRVPVYCGQRQIALIRRDFRQPEGGAAAEIIAPDEGCGAIGTLFFAYLYAQEPDRLLRRKTGNRFLLEKDDRNFASGC